MLSYGVGLKKGFQLIVGGLGVLSSTWTSFEAESMKACRISLSDGSTARQRDIILEERMGFVEILKKTVPISERHGSHPSLNVNRRWRSFFGSVCQIEVSRGVGMMPYLTREMHGLSSIRSKEATKSLMSS